MRWLLHKTSSASAAAASSAGANTSGGVAGKGLLTYKKTDNDAEGPDQAAGGAVNDAALGEDGAGGGAKGAGGADDAGGGGGGGGDGGAGGEGGNAASATAKAKLIGGGEGTTAEGGTAVDTPLYDALAKLQDEGHFQEQDIRSALAGYGGLNGGEELNHRETNWLVSQICMYPESERIPVLLELMAQPLVSSCIV